jgi:integrase
LTERAASVRDRLAIRAEARQAEAHRATVREARGHVKGFEPARAVSANTAGRYSATVTRMKQQGQQPEHADCKSSFEFRRAALVHVTRANLKAGLRDIDRAKRTGDLAAANEAYCRVLAGVQTLSRYPPSTGNREQDMQRQSAYRGPRWPARSNSKRESARAAALPADWRDRMQCAACPSDRTALAVMAITGCRPAEVRGVKVQQDECSLKLTIPGAKVDETRGVNVREVTLDKAMLTQTQAGRDLKAWLGERSIRTVAYRGSCEALRDRTARAAKRAGLDNVTAYTYRHAMARDLRLEGASQSEISARLGHRAERSARDYG